MREKATGKTRHYACAAVAVGDNVGIISVPTHVRGKSPHQTFSLGGGNNSGDGRAPGNLCINFTRVRSVNPNVLQVYFFSNWVLFFSFATLLDI